MKYSKNDLIEFVNENDIKFIRLAYCDVFGVQKNISVMTPQLEFALNGGISINALAVSGFGNGETGDLFLMPDTNTFELLPWRPQHGRVARLYCNITYVDGQPFEHDTRYILQKTVDEASEKGYSFSIGNECEFYLFKSDEDGNLTNIPMDRGGYMDIAPEDRGENIRRDICLTMEEMGIKTESSHHETGPGQNGINLGSASPLTACDNLMTFKWAVKTIASLNGLYASFLPKPISDAPGNGLHLKLSIKNVNREIKDSFAAGLLSHAPETTVFYNHRIQSYMRLGTDRAPLTACTGNRNSAPYLRLPTAENSEWDMTLRSPDTMVNPYLACAILIRTGIDGIEKKLRLEDVQSARLPESFEVAAKIASKNDFIKSVIPKSLLDVYEIYGGN